MVRPAEVLRPIQTEREGEGERGSAYFGRMGRIDIMKRERVRVREKERKEKEIREEIEREIRDRARVREREEIEREIREEIEREIRDREKRKREIRRERGRERERKIEKRRTILLECKLIQVQYEGHRHLLKFRKIIDLKDQVKCWACDSNCDSYTFSCLDLLDPYCTFNLHHTCGPLPYTIKHKCHIHSLILTHSLAIDEDYQTDDEFYCDVCEEQRDPLLPIYQCMECLFVTEIKCVISKVISLLEGEHGDVELKDPIGLLGRVMVQKKLEEQHKPAFTTLDGILKSLSQDENNELSSVEKAIEREIATAVEILSDDDDEVVVFSDKAYTKFIKFLDDHSIDNIPIGSNQDFKVSQDWDLEDEVVKVGEYYAAIQMMAPILSHLLSKHEDISTESMFSPSVKVFLFNILCECIYEMTNIKVVDITHDLLFRWSARLKTLERAGFRIQFAVDHLKRLLRAHFGLYVKEEVKKIDRDIDRLEKDLKARKVKRERITSESTKSTFIAECLREASVLKE